MKGLSIGGTMRLRGDRFIGFEESPDGEFVSGGAYNGGSTEIYDAMIRYRKKIFNNVNWSIQLNIKNLLDDTDLLPSQTDGLGLDNVVRWRFQEPRTYQLSNTFKF